MKDITKYHPCFSAYAHFRYARVHLPVAPKCNIKCKFCERKLNNNDMRPGVSSKIFSPKEAIENLKRVLSKNLPVKVVAVTGPGDALSNPETFETLYLIKKKFPDLIRCMATNGLMVLDYIEELKDLVNTITISIHAVDPDIAKNIYEHIHVNGKKIKGKDACKILIEKQLNGLKLLSSSNITVKINSVLIPGINDKHMVDIAKSVKKYGANIMNIIPIIPLGKFSNIKKPTKEDICFVQDKCSVYIEQFRNCRQCRADACGIPGERDEFLG